MIFSKIAQFVGRTIGLALGLYFSIYYMGMALLSLSRNNSQIIAVVCLSVIIAIITLANSRNKIIE
ncbi:MAG: hypothetical protein ACREV6_00840 [Clostridium sp.]|uniref:hypothetical protein n=1 Tax=Clostridium sp. TaxID=1506 RepID=UPI003D6D5487